MENNIKNIVNNRNVITADFSVKNALERLNTFGVSDALTLFILDAGNKLLGVITDGDVRRGLVNGLSIESNVTLMMNSNFKFLRKNDYSINELNGLRNAGIKLVPILDEFNVITRLINLQVTRSILPIDVLIMAGGRGERLKPLTNNTPKPLLNVGDKPIIEHNIDRLISYGVDSISISVKYLKEKIIDYCKDGSEKGISIHYIEESYELGTIGSLSMIKDPVHDDILIMNSDILTNIDFEDFYYHYKESGADMAVATVPYHIDLPYAILEIEEGKVISLKEKPRYTYFANAGIYIIKKGLLKMIPDQQFYNATDLMEKIVQQNFKLIQYPILGYWLDIGRINDYDKAQEDIKIIKF